MTKAQELRQNAQNRIALAHFAENYPKTKRLRQPERMDTTRCRPEEFEITAEGITHKPTGYSFRAHLGQPTSATENEGHLGSVLKDGRDYQPNEVKEMARELWRRRLLAK